MKPSHSPPDVISPTGRKISYGQTLPDLFAYHSQNSCKKLCPFFFLLLVYFFVFGDKAAKAVRPVCDLCVLLLPQSSGYLSYITVSLCFILLWRNGNAELFFFSGYKVELHYCSVSFNPFIQ